MVARSLPALVVALLVALSVLAPAAPARAEFVDATITLNGFELDVSWNDGDSFSFKQGKGRRKRARLMDVNTLENFGPVHRWGDWSPWELYLLSREPARIAASKTWKCTSTGNPDGYGRLLVRCPDLARELVKLGQAMVFAVDAPPAKDLVALQREAQKKKVGMWKKGVPPKLITSAHSVLEGKGYIRVADTRTGEASIIEHKETFGTCEQVCAGEGRSASCMVYVPFKRRYEEQPPCIVDPRVKLGPPHTIAAK